jgi:DNA-directed RNA polymerase specialized sigma24 family protein
MSSILGPKGLEFAKARGPRWAVIGRVRSNEDVGDYEDTAELAERRAEKYRELGYYQVQVYPAVGSVDLRTLGEARRNAKEAYDEATAILRAGVLRALEENRSEAEIARTAGVDRMTVRSWAGKG